MKPCRALVTGGAGFIGSHVVDRLAADGAEVVVYDNFTTGSRRNLAAAAGRPGIRVVEADVLDLPRLTAALDGVDTVFHFQANADVRQGVGRTRVDLEQNTIATWNVLEAMRSAGARTLVFASSATVYGEPAVFPTPETAPLCQTSLYGASKLAGEAMIEAFSEYFGIRSLIFRFVSWIGPRYRHGVVADFVQKLQADPGRLAILGDGRQKKSYLHVDDGVAGIFLALERATGPKAVFNLGHDDGVTVMTVAELVAAELGVRNVRLEPAGGSRGWPGDSPLVQLDTGRMKALGWKPTRAIPDGIRETVRSLTGKL